MMKLKKSLRQKDILLPAPAALVVTGNREYSNIITIAWIGIMGSEPPTIAISLRENRHSLKMLKKYKEFTVNIPNCSLLKKVDFCGMFSGNSVDKFETTKLTKVNAKTVDTPIIEECPLNIECKVIEHIGRGKWQIILGEIAETQLDSDCFNEDDKINIESIDPLVYMPTIREYWSIGSMIGNSFQANSNSFL